LKKSILTSLLNIIFFTVLFICAGQLFAQNDTKNDTASVVLHSPKKATLLALMPGAGQIYNKKYWKLPLVYAGFATTGYFAISNRAEYIKYNNAYKCLLNNPESCDDELAIKYTADQIKSARDYYRRNMELSFILMGVWYIFQMLDAAVDAHLYYWEVNDDLSVKLEPTMQQLPMQLSPSVVGNSLNNNGLKVTVSF